MSGQRTIAACLVIVASVAMLAAGDARAESERQNALRGIGDIEATSSVTLDRLSVRMLGVDKPWNPHICIGCELNNGSQPVRTGRYRPR